MKKNLGLWFGATKAPTIGVMCYFLESRGGTTQQAEAAAPPLRIFPAAAPLRHPAYPREEELYAGKTGRRRHHCHPGFRAAATKESTALLRAAREDVAAIIRPPAAAEEPPSVLGSPFSRAPRVVPSVASILQGVVAPPSASSYRRPPFVTVVQRGGALPPGGDEVRSKAGGGDIAANGAPAVPFLFTHHW